MSEAIKGVTKCELWLCIDCTIAEVYGDVSPYRPADLPEVLSAIPEGMRLLPGRLNEDHSCDRGNGEDIEGCDCEVDTFSRPECDGCGDWHHGERHAFIGWTEVPA
jgi:hypothetical protein